MCLNVLSSSESVDSTCKFLKISVCFMIAKVATKLRRRLVLQVPCQILKTFPAWPTSASTCCF